MTLLTGVNIFLLDIEGTTTSISFVKDVLFPWIRKNLRKYIVEHWDDTSLQNNVANLRQHIAEDIRNELKGVPQLPPPESTGDVIQEAVIENILWQMDLDRKTTALKELQGLMWKDGYDSGELKGHVYTDVPPFLKSCTDNGKKVAIYSSGSIAAQKLLFGCSEAGDLTKFLHGYFDTTIGPKFESSSYTKISSALQCPPQEILFLTDVAKEAYAARAAGLKTAVMIRDGNVPLTSDDMSAFETLSDFTTLQI